MPVRAKFKVISYNTNVQTVAKRDADGNYLKDDEGRYINEDVEMRTVKMSPVYANNDPKHENSRFWNATPSGSIELGTINPEAWSHFEIGKEYYVDFTPAE